MADKKTWTWKPKDIKMTRVLPLSSGEFYVSFTEPANSFMKKEVTIKGKGKKKRYDLISHYSVRIWYQVRTEKSDKWFILQENLEVKKSKAGATRSTQNISGVPDNAIAVKCSVKIVLNDNGKSYYNSPGFIAIAKNRRLKLKEDEIGIPSAPEVDLTDNTVTLSVTTTEENIATHIIFDIIKETYEEDEDGARELVRESIFGDNQPSVKLVQVGSTRKATYQKTLSDGTYFATAEYAHMNSNGDFDIIGKTSEEASISGGGSTGTGFPPGIPSNVKVSRVSRGIMRVTWDAVEGMTERNGNYTVQFATKEDLIATGSTASTTGTAIEVSVDDGYKYFVRVKATRNGIDGTWSGIVEGVVATKPNPPTIWSMKNNAEIGETIKLYVTHNSADASKPVSGNIEWWTDRKPGNKYTIDINYSDLDIDNPDYTKDVDLFIDSNKVSDGDKIIWHARTSNFEYTSDYSNPGEIQVYFPATLDIVADTILYSYPYNIIFESGPSSQLPLSLSFEIYANESYETTNFYGEKIFVNQGDLVFSKLYTAKDNLTNHFQVSLKPQDISLESDVQYLIKAKVSMNSGQTKESGMIFTVSLEDVDMEIDCEISVNDESLSAAIIPSAWIEGSELDEEGDPILVLANNVMLNVFRLNYDGTFTTIAKNIENTNSTLVSDPHVPMRNATYRITAVDKNSGSISYEDFSADTDLKTTGVIIQWDESYRTNIAFIDDMDSINTEDLDSLSRFGTTILLPYNVKLQESSNKDVEFVDYQGREESVSYYGTKRGKTSNINAEFDKEDEETIYKLRRLDNWMGDAYIREQSGIGYWANINVSMNMDYDNLVVPVTLSITKVDSDRY